MVLYENELDPAFRFEGLARTAFDDCSKRGDPFGIAAQECYSNFVPIPTLKGKIILSKVFIKLIIDYPQYSRFIEIEDLIWNLNTQEEIINVIDEGIKILNEMEK